MRWIGWRDARSDRGTGCCCGGGRHFLRRNCCGFLFVLFVVCLFLGWLVTLLHLWCFTKNSFMYFLPVFPKKNY
jgi:hypothetical protein